MFSEGTNELVIKKKVNIYLSQFCIQQESQNLSVWRLTLSSCFRRTMRGHFLNGNTDSNKQIGMGNPSLIHSKKKNNYAWDFTLDEQNKTYKAKKNFISAKVIKYNNLHWQTRTEYSTQIIYPYSTFIHFSQIHPIIHFQDAQR